MVSSQNGSLGPAVPGPTGLAHAEALAGAGVAAAVADMTACAITAKAAINRYLDNIVQRAERSMVRRTTHGGGFIALAMHKRRIHMRANEAPAGNECKT